MGKFVVVACLVALSGCTLPTSDSSVVTFVQTESISKHFTVLAGSDSDFFFPVFPNPFSRATGDRGVTIEFSLSDSARVIVLVQNPIGEEIIRFMDSTARPGLYSGLWDPIDASGEGLEPGLYFLTVNIRSLSEQNETRPNYIESRMLQILNN